MNYYGRDKEVQIKVGLMTVMTVIILFFGYSWLRDWFGKGKYNDFQVMFTNAGNIEVGNPVTVYGAKRGRVESVTVRKDGVLVNLLLQIDFPLPIDTKFVISDSNLMGSRQVDVIPGKEKTYIETGFIAQGESLSSLSSLVPKIDGMISEINLLVNLLSGSDDLPGKLMDTIEVTHNIAIKIDRILGDNEQDFNEAVNNFLHSAKQLNDLIAVNKDNISETVEGAAGTVGKLDKSLARLDAMLTSLEPLIDKVSTEEGTIQKMITDEDLYQRVLSITGKVDSLLVDIKKNPKRYFKLTVF